MAKLTLPFLAINITYAKKPGFYEKLLVLKLEMYEETRFLTSEEKGNNKRVAKLTLPFLAISN